MCEKCYCVKNLDATRTLGALGHLWDRAKKQAMVQDSLLLELQMIDADLQSIGSRDGQYLNINISNIEGDKQNKHVFRFGSPTKYIRYTVGNECVPACIFFLFHPPA